ncbi:MAG: KpsF/GutQ family sugar-phosphate isomerase [Alphaproteobacteria bacterium]|nr:KpsF/GutQ family sugar-phosphate isomerase [Alphaproteobacteria bacterium]
MSAHEILHAAAHVLAAEGAALRKLSETLGDGFVRATETVLECKGRVIVTGMGKSGHVARKIAATLASTGTPSHFVHPGEASHGDLGMITRDDVVIALSNSGEAPELVNLINYTRRFSIPLIAVTSRDASTLGSASDIIVPLPPEPEVCPMGLAPTTSTTMMLALGDALAIAVMESKGFTADDFRNFHPGGKLGTTLLRVREIMRKDGDIPVVAPDDKMQKVLLIMTQKSLGCAGIVDAEGRLAGIITDGDLRRHMQDADFLNRSAAQVMNASPMTVGPNILAVEALKLLNDKARTQLFVVENGKPVGVLHIHDLLRAGVA